MQRNTLVLALALLVGCTGELSGGSVERPDEAAPPQPRCTPEAAPAGIRHLTRAEYDRTVRALLGVEGTFSSAFPPDDAVAGFEVGATLSPLLVEAQVEAALDLGARVATDPAALLGCDPSAAGCVEGWLPGWLRRAYRRPPSEEELGRAMALYESGAGDGGPREGVHRLVAGVLASPQFLYHLPPGSGAPGEVVTLDDHALASRLSYFLWGTMPDDELAAAADAGLLSEGDGLATQARRMLDDPRAREGIGAFFRQWLGTEKLANLTRDPAHYPEASPELGAALAGSLERYVEHVFFEGDARLETLLLGNFAFLNERLASLYGVSGVEGEALTRVELDPARRAGLLTQPAFMALLAKDDQSDPIHRGLFVRTQLLCHALPDPPMNVDLVVSAPEPGASTRERFAAHTADPSCRSCHQLIDPIGFSFEHYDALGRWRDEDQGVPVDASGELLATEDVDGPVDGALELSSRLAESWQVSGCMVQQWMRFALARALDDEDTCEVQRLRRQLVLSGGDLRELVVAIATSDAFRKRRIPTGGDDV